MSAIQNTRWDEEPTPRTQLTSVPSPRVGAIRSALRDSDFRHDAVRLAAVTATWTVLGAVTLLGGWGAILIAWSLFG